MTVRPGGVDDVGVLAFVPDCFDEPWQSRHQILTRLASYFPVVWVDPAPHWRDLATRWRSRARQADGARDAFEVYSTPRWLPQVHRPAWLGRHIERLRLEQARRRLLERGCRRIVLSVWRPSFRQVLDLVPHDIAAYHIDDEYTFAMDDIRPDEGELQLIAAVNIVSVHSRGLLERKGGINPRTVFLPNGVDYARYATPAPEPPDMRHIPRPRVGYTGYLKQQLDWDLLRALITSHRDRQFVFVGPCRPNSGLEAIVESLSREPNAHFLGARRVDELAAYAQHCDVCVMPYRTSAYASYIYPLKLHEYLATGRPVIGTPIGTLTEFADVVTLAGTQREWSSAIDACLMPVAQTASARAARQAVARRHDWDTIARRMAKLIADSVCAAAPPGTG